MKKRYYSHILSFFFLGLSILTAIPLFVIYKEKVEINVVRGEDYNPKLHYLNSIDKIIDYADSVYNYNSNNDFDLQGIDTAVYVSIVSDLIKKRFYFGLSNYNISQNWIAALFGELFWPHLSAIVEPNDILHYSEGLCSQQTIVFMEILKKRGIKVRSVGLGKKEGPGHFLCEVYYRDSWRLHDVTKEPQWFKITNHHQSMDYYIHNKDSLYKVYENSLPKEDFNKLLEKIAYGKPNEFPAKNMLLFHQITLILTYIIPLFFLLLFFISFNRRM